MFISHSDIHFCKVNVDFLPMFLLDYLLVICWNKYFLMDGSPVSII